MATPQVNIRVPEDARGVLLKVGARLRNDPAFASQLRRFMATLDDPTVGPSIIERVEVLEMRLLELEGTLRGE